MRKLITFFISALMIGCTDIFDYSMTRLAEYRISDTSKMYAKLIEGNATTEDVVRVEYVCSGRIRKVLVYPRYNWAKFSLSDSGHVLLALLDTSSSGMSDTFRVNIKSFE